VWVLVNGISKLVLQVITYTHTQSQTTSSVQRNRGLPQNQLIMLNGVGTNFGVGGGG